MSVSLRNSFRDDDDAMRYSTFVPRQIDFCPSLGMKPDRIKPLRAFHSDTNQGFPIMLIAEHVGSFTSNQAESVVLSRQTDTVLMHIMGRILQETSP